MSAAYPQSEQFVKAAMEQWVDVEGSKVKKQVIVLLGRNVTVQRKTNLAHYKFTLTDNETKTVGRGKAWKFLEAKQNAVEQFVANCLEAKVPLEVNILNNKGDVNNLNNIFDVKNNDNNVNVAKIVRDDKLAQENEDPENPDAVPIPKIFRELQDEKIRKFNNEANIPIDNNNNNNNHNNNASIDGKNDKNVKEAKDKHVSGADRSAKESQKLDNQNNNASSSDNINKNIQQNNNNNNQSVHNNSPNNNNNNNNNQIKKQTYTKKQMEEYATLSSVLTIIFVIISLIAIAISPSFGSTVVTSSNSPRIIINTPATLDSHLQFNVSSTLHHDESHIITLDDSNSQTHSIDNSTESLNTTEMNHQENNHLNTTLEGASSDSERMSLDFFEDFKLNISKKVQILTERGVIPKSQKNIVTLFLTTNLTYSEAISQSLSHSPPSSSSSSSNSETSHSIPHSSSPKEHPIPQTEQLQSNNLLSYVLYAVGGMLSIGALTFFFYDKYTFQEISYFWMAVISFILAFVFTQLGFFVLERSSTFSGMLLSVAISFIPVFCYSVECQLGYWKTVIPISDVNRNDHINNDNNNNNNPKKAEVLKHFSNLFVNPENYLFTIKGRGWQYFPMEILVLIFSSLLLVFVNTACFVSILPWSFLYLFIIDLCVAFLPKGISSTSKMDKATIIIYTLIITKLVVFLLLPFGSIFIDDNSTVIGYASIQRTQNILWWGILLSVLVLLLTIKSNVRLSKKLHERSRMNLFPNFVMSIICLQVLILFSDFITINVIVLLALILLNGFSPLLFPINQLKNKLPPAFFYSLIIYLIPVFVDLFPFTHFIIERYFYSTSVFSFCLHIAATIVMETSIYSNLSFNFQSFLSHSMKSPPHSSPNQADNMENLKMRHDNSSSSLPPPLSKQHYPLLLIILSVLIPNILLVVYYHVTIAGVLIPHLMIQFVESLMLNFSKTSTIYIRLNPIAKKRYLERVRYYTYFLVVLLITFRYLGLIFHAPQNIIDALQLSFLFSVVVCVFFEFLRQCVNRYPNGFESRLPPLQQHGNTTYMGPNLEELLRILRIYEIGSFLFIMAGCNLVFTILCYLTTDFFIQYYFHLSRSSNRNNNNNNKNNNNISKTREWICLKLLRFTLIIGALYCIISLSLSYSPIASFGVTVTLCKTLSFMGLSFIWLSPFLYFIACNSPVELMEEGIYFLVNILDNPIYREGYVRRSFSSSDFVFFSSQIILFVAALKTRNGLMLILTAVIGFFISFILTLRVATTLRLPVVCYFLQICSLLLLIASAMINMVDAAFIIASFMVEITAVILIALSALSFDQSVRGSPILTTLNYWIYGLIVLLVSECKLPNGYYISSVFGEIASFGMIVIAYFGLWAIRSKRNGNAQPSLVRNLLFVINALNQNKASEVDLNENLIPFARTLCTLISFTTLITSKMTNSYLMYYLAFILLLLRTAHVRRQKLFSSLFSCSIFILGGVLTQSLLLVCVGGFLLFFHLYMISYHHFSKEIMVPVSLLVVGVLLLYFGYIYETITKQSSYFLELLPSYVLQMQSQFGSRLQSFTLQYFS